MVKVRRNLAEEEVSKFQAARALLDRQDSTLADLQSRAAQIGINITFEVQHLWDDNPRVLSATTPGPLRRRHMAQPKPFILRRSVFRMTNRAQTG